MEDEYKKDEHKIEVYESIDNPVTADKKRLITTGGHFAYLKIAEGCNKCCSYCIIPSIRGHYRSVPMEQIIEKIQPTVKVEKIIKPIYNFKAGGM